MPNDRTTVIVEDDPTDAALINRALKVKPVEAVAFNEEIARLFAYWLSANQPEVDRT